MVLSLRLAGVLCVGLALPQAAVGLGKLLDWWLRTSTAGPSGIGGWIDVVAGTMLLGVQGMGSWNVVAHVVPAAIGIAAVGVGACLALGRGQRFWVFARKVMP